MTSLHNSPVSSTRGRDTSNCWRRLRWRTRGWRHKCLSCQSLIQLPENTLVNRHQPSPPKPHSQNSEGLVQICPDTPPLGPGKGGLSTSAKDSATQRLSDVNSEMILLAAKLRFDKRICRARGGFHGRCDVGSLGGLTSHKYNIPNHTKHMFQNPPTSQCSRAA